MTPIRELLALPAPADEPISLLDHYGRSAWVGLDDEVNVGVRAPWSVVQGDRRVGAVDVDEFDAFAASRHPTAAGHRPNG